MLQVHCECQALSRFWLSAFQLVALSMADDSQDAEGDISPSLWPAAGKLASAWEEHKQLRDLLRDKGHFSCWPSATSVGLQSVRAMGLNCLALEIMAEYWAPVPGYPKTLPIELMRQEAGSGQS